ncbi:MAG: hypothetical protein LBQ48_00145 [Oscillospiraceae bacterium]|jgi:hypothetical protein|nr:hypothetical protein [Oscillospiraceae bacterium]
MMALSISGCDKCADAVSPLSGGFSYGDAVSVDQLGRAVNPVSEQKSDKEVGLFYFLWNGQHSRGNIYDITKIFEKDPDIFWAENTPESPETAFHYWSEPLFGYYDSSDMWVIRKQVEMLTWAQIDYLVFDTTNAGIYENVFMNLLSVLEEYRAEGWNVPKIVFYTNSYPKETVQGIYNALYGKNLYRDLWYIKDGKPMIISKASEIDAEMRAFFMVKETQWPFGEEVANGYPWIDWRRPQHMAYGLDGFDVVSVSVAQHPGLPMSNSVRYPEKYNDNWGRGYHNGANDPEAIDRGANFQEQWDTAIRMNPQTIFITGWNEWVAQKLPDGDSYMMVDQFNKEFSRDIEPMKGGFGDNYYLQMIENIRKFKGASADKKEVKKTAIKISGAFSQWDAVDYGYKDFKGDTADRKSASAAPELGDDYYTDTTGRNDFEELRVTYDSKNVYFLATTARDITPNDNSGRWMNLFIGTQGLTQTGFEGYDYVINRTPRDSKTTSVEKSNGGYDWTDCGRAEYRVSGRYIHIAVPRSALGITSDQFTVHFKWTDNITDPADIMNCYTSGDAAPIGRLSYSFSVK